MRIAMFTNTYLPQIGGVAISVNRFAEGYRKRGHPTHIVAPEYDEAGSSEQDEADVTRVTSLTRFGGGPFSLALPITFEMEDALDAFRPEIVHSHHPYLLGDSAARAAAQREIPLVFTYHTQYEHYTYYASKSIAALRPFVVRLAAGYANLCDLVVAPSESIRDMLRDRGVRSEIEVIPTGVDGEAYRRGDGGKARAELRIRDKAFLVGHVGRFAKEKNLLFLCRAVAEFLRRRKEAHFLAVGEGDAASEMKAVFARAGVEERVRFPGKRTGQALVNAYHAMDAFAFASKTETQGMVLVEALAAGTPVVALDAPGAREVVRDTLNGRLVTQETEADFAEALEWIADRASWRERRHRDAVSRTADPFDTEVCVSKALSAYERAIAADGQRGNLEDSEWMAALRSLKCDWDIWANRLSAVSAAMSNHDEPRSPKGKK